MGLTVLRHRALSESTRLELHRIDLTASEALLQDFQMGLWCKLSDPTKRNAREIESAHAAGTTFQISGAVLPFDAF